MIHNKALLLWGLFLKESVSHFTLEWVILRVVIRRVVAALPIMPLATQWKEGYELELWKNLLLSPPGCHYSHADQAMSHLDSATASIQPIPSCLVPPGSSPPSSQEEPFGKVNPIMCLLHHALLRAWPLPTPPISCLLPPTLSACSRAKMFLLPSFYQVFLSPLDFYTCNYKSRPHLASPDSFSSTSPYPLRIVLRGPCSVFTNHSTLALAI